MNNHDQTPLKPVFLDFKFPFRASFSILTKVSTFLSVFVDFCDIFLVPKVFSLFFSLYRCIKTNFAKQNLFLYTYRERKKTMQASSCSLRSLRKVERFKKQWSLPRKLGILHCFLNLPPLLFFLKALFSISMYEYVSIMMEGG